MDEKQILILTTSIFAVLALLCSGIFTMWMVYRRRKIDAEKEKVMLNQKHMQELLHAQLDIQSQTMQEIGREIHDNVGQKLTLASLYTQQIAQDNKYPELKEQVQNISTAMAESLRDLRSLSKSLTNAEVAEQSLKALLEKEMQKIGKASGYNTHCEIDGANGFSALTKSVIIRIVQEFFQNSMKHANGTMLYLKLKRMPEGFELFLKDDGKGFKYSPNKNFARIGLKNMMERAALINSNATINSKEGEGTNLLLFIKNENL